MGLTGQLMSNYTKLMVDGCTVMNESQTLMAVAIARVVKQTWVTRSANTPPTRTVFAGDIAAFCVERDENGELKQGETIMHTQSWFVNQIRKEIKGKTVIEPVISSPFDKSEGRNSQNVNLTRYFGDGVRKLCVQAMTEAGKRAMVDRTSITAINPEYSELVQATIQISKEMDENSGSSGHVSPVANAIAHNMSFDDLMNVAKPTED